MSGTSRLSLRARVMTGAVLWTIGLLSVVSVIGILVLLGHPIQHAFVLHIFFIYPGSSLVVAAVCMVLGFWQVRKGLSALDDVRCQREDLDEMLGNLLDNACKWARSRVTLSSSPDGGGIAVVVDDDGPGIDPALHDAVLQRGVRADEAAPGSGLGLAIVRDLAEVYGGSIALDRSPMGGLRARLHLPRA